MGALDLEVVKSRATKGILVLTGRTFFLNVITFAAQGFLWALLSSYEFGVFWIVSAVVNFLSYFSDIGLAAALIQKKENPSQEDLRTTFTIQQGLIVILFIILVLLSPFLVRLHGLSFDGKMLLYGLAISFFLSSLKTIPTVILERKLEFGKLVIPQVIETVVYNVILVYLAYSGFGLKSFTYAVIIRSLVGLVIIYVLSPWKPALVFSKRSLSGLLQFGLPYQVNTLLATLKDDGIIIALGSILGPAGVGILGTAQRLAQYPLRFFMDNVTKVTFPAFSRMQGEKAQLARSVTRSIFFICFLVFPSIVGLVIISPILVEVIPRYEKWTPALLPLAIISINTIFAAVTTQLTNMLNAVGKIKTTFFLMLMWTIITWVAVPLLSLKFGVNGAAFGYALVSLSSVVAIYLAKRVVSFSLTDSAIKPLAASLFMGLVLLVVKQFLPASFYSVWILTITGIVIYGFSMLILVGVSLISDVKKTFKTIFSK
ncbi:MAG: oligosaccharide flippase family protein [Patescibacteria group bacterium]